MSQFSIGQRVTGKPIYERGELAWGGPMVFVVSEVRLIQPSSKLDPLPPYHRIKAIDPERPGCYIEGAERFFRPAGDFDAQLQAALRASNPNSLPGRRY
jgi:hypothetical protein